MPYRWVRDKPLYRVGDAAVTRGEVFEPTDAVQERYAEWLEPADSDATPGGSDGETPEENADASEATAESGAEDTPDVSEMHWRSAVAAIESGEYDDVLAGIDDDRSSVQDAIAARRDEVA